MNNTYVQIFAPIREKELIIHEMSDLVVRRVLPDRSCITLAAAGSFDFRNSRATEFASRIYALEINAPHRVSEQKKRAYKFATKASTFETIICLYVPGEMATIELDTFVRACNKPVSIIAFQRSK